MGLLSIKNTSNGDCLWTLFVGIGEQEGAGLRGPWDGLHSDRSPQGHVKPLVSGNESFGFNLQGASFQLHQERRVILRWSPAIQERSGLRAPGVGETASP